MENKPALLSDADCSFTETIYWKAIQNDSSEVSIFQVLAAAVQASTAAFFSSLTTQTETAKDLEQSEAPPPICDGELDDFYCNADCQMEKKSKRQSTIAGALRSLGRRNSIAPFDSAQSTTAGPSRSQSTTAGASRSGAEVTRTATWTVASLRQEFMGLPIKDVDGWIRSVTTEDGSLNQQLADDIITGMRTSGAGPSAQRPEASDNVRLAAFGFARTRDLPSYRSKAITRNPSRATSCLQMATTSGAGSSAQPPAASTSRDGTTPTARPAASTSRDGTTPTARPAASRRPFVEQGASYSLDAARATRIPVSQTRADGRQEMATDPTVSSATRIEESRRRLYNWPDVLPGLGASGNSLGMIKMTNREEGDVFIPPRDLSDLQASGPDCILSKPGGQAFAISGYRVTIVKVDDKPTLGLIALSQTRADGRQEMATHGIKDMKYFASPIDGGTPYYLLPDGYTSHRDSRSNYIVATDARGDFHIFSECGYDRQQVVLESQTRFALTLTPPYMGTELEVPEDLGRESTWQKYERHGTGEMRTVTVDDGKEIFILPEGYCHRAVGTAYIGATDAKLKPHIFFADGYEVTTVHRTDVNTVPPRPGLCRRPDLCRRDEDLMQFSSEDLHVTLPPLVNLTENL